MQGLGELETAVMEVLWRGTGPLRVRDVLDALDTGRKLAYTTVMTVLDNLHRKGWVTRQLDGRAYRYLAKTSREDAVAHALRELLDSATDRESVLLKFARSVSPQDSAVLRRALGDSPADR
ncbi:BlaI/MecI/CopY family transcriptional regulator [Lentzea sp. NPDC005914]|uniref:BlaI/MecI/CopY family transcriptional regulator n=1 Tax=Lentzea sp. NPDC005914 TaxID=3154572 RepID=UPI0033DD92DD